MLVQAISSMWTCKVSVTESRKVQHIFTYITDIALGLLDPLQIFTDDLPGTLVKLHSSYFSFLALQMAPLSTAALSHRKHISRGQHIIAAILRDTIKGTFPTTSYQFYFLILTTIIIFCCVI